MACLRFQQSRIAGISCCVPSEFVATQQLAEQLNSDAKRIVSMTGIQRRPQASMGVCASDLCEKAAVSLLDQLGWKSEEVEALVFVSQTPDYSLPATACTLQHRLGLPTSAVCFDINMGCSGYVYGLSVVFSLIESGIQRALLLVGDVLSPVVSSQDKSTVFLFGDAGSATAIRREASPSTFVLGTDGTGKDQLIIPAGQARQRVSLETQTRRTDESGNARSDTELYMNGAEVMAFTLKEVPRLFEDLLSQSGVQREQLQSVVMHQANQFLLDNLVRKMQVDRSRVPLSLSQFGNTSCTSIPLTIATELQAASKLDAMLVAMLGFGVGWSWAGCTLDLGGVEIPPLAYF